MTQTTPRPSTVANSTATDSTAARTGTAWITGGALWLVAGLLHAGSGWRFDAAALAWFGADLLVAAGIVGLLVLRPHGRSGIGAGALVVALVARAAFAVGEITSIIDGNDEGPLIPLGALLTAVAMTAYGIVVLRRHRKGGLNRWSFLAMGIYPFIAMFPVLAITGEPSDVLIALWGLPAAFIGFATRSVSMSMQAQ